VLETWEDCWAKTGVLVTAHFGNDFRGGGNVHNHSVPLKKEKWVYRLRSFEYITSVATNDQMSNMQQFAYKRVYAVSCL
jgi:hypothetical protein